MKLTREIEDSGNLLALNVNQTNTNESLLSIDMQFNDGHLLSIIVYSILMVFSAIGNITVLVLILRRRRKIPSRINTMLLHLAIADLFVSNFVLICIQVLLCTFSLPII